MINVEDRLPRQHVRLIGRQMSIAAAGRGPVILFLHGNPTYSYIWRNIIPFLAQDYRCLAPDLMGMGRSDLILPSGPSSYRLSDQLDHLELLIEILQLDRPMVLVGHELGGALAVQFARRHPELTAGLVLIEAVLRVTNDTKLDSQISTLLKQLRGHEGERLVLTENLLVERYLPTLTARRLAPAEMEAYREPYSKPGESRRAMLSMIRQLPIQSDPGPIADVVGQNRLWCAQSPIPKLVIGGKPGFLVPTSILGTAARWNRTQVASVQGRHYLMEDSPARLTTLCLDWLTSIRHPA